MIRLDEPCQFDNVIGTGFYNLLSTNDRIRIPKDSPAFYYINALVEAKQQRRRLN